MTRRWEAEYRGGGRFLIRPRPRLGRLAGVGCAVVVCAGATSRLWDRADAWLHAATHATARHLAGTALVCAVLVWLWVRSGRS